MKFMDWLRGKGHKAPDDPVPVPVPEPTPTPLPEPEPVADCGPTSDWSALWPPPWPYQNPVARWCTPARPFALTVYDRTGDPFWHAVIVEAARLWSASGVATLTVVEQPGNSLVATPPDEIAMVITSYYEAPGTGAYGGLGYEYQSSPGVDNAFMCSPVVRLNDYWRDFYSSGQGSLEYITSFLAMGGVGHEIGHGLGLWHPAIPAPTEYSGTMGGGGAGPAGDFVMLRALYGVT